MLEIFDESTDKSCLSDNFRIFVTQPVSKKYHDNLENQGGRDVLAQESQETVINIGHFLESPCFFYILMVETFSIYFSTVPSFEGSMSDSLVNNW